MSLHPARRRRAITLLEILIVISIIGVLIFLLLPAVAAMRESARRLQCQNNLTQLTMSIQHYEYANRFYPPGVVDAKGPVLNQPKGNHHNWISQTLPFREGGSTYRHIDFGASVYDARHGQLKVLHFPLLSCPSTSVPSWGPYGAISNYAAMHHDSTAPIDSDNNGMFFLNSHLRRDDVADGLPHTIFLGEKTNDLPTDLGWMSGTNATLRNMGRPLNFFDSTESWVEALFPQDIDYTTFAGTATVDGFGSDHQGGSSFTFGDGHIRFFHSSVDLKILQSLANRHDGELLGLSD